MHPTRHPARHATAHTGRIVRLAVLWLLALVLPLQGTAAVVFAAMGPAHVHRAASAPAPVLEDFRRWKPAVQRAEHVFAALGHFHAGHGVQRHRHAGDDASVVPSAADVGDADEAATVASVAMLAPLPHVGEWHAPAGASAQASRPAWPVLTGFATRMDRPPRPQG